MLRYHNATIRQVSNGFHIQIGCTEVVAETPEKLKELICRYLDDPIGMKKEMMKYDRPVDPSQHYPVPPEPTGSGGGGRQEGYEVGAIRRTR